MAVGASYHLVAVSRARDLKNRLGFAILIAVAATTISHPFWPAMWLAAVIVSQLLNAWAGKSAKDDPAHVASRGWEFRYLAITALTTGTFAAITPYCWFQGGMEGRLIALVILMASMLNVMVQ